MEGKYAPQRFYLTAPHRLRCFYCENDITHFVVANRKTRHFSTDISSPHEFVRKDRDVVFFADEKAAAAAGYSAVKRRRKATG
jgi:hypothetical protein